MAPNGKTPFSVNLKNVTIVKPAQLTPSEILSFSTIDNDPNFEFRFQYIQVFRSNIIPSSANGNGISDPALVLKQGLARALVYYYPLAGKLKRQTDGTLRITCNGDGVPFAEATADCSLESLNYLDEVDPQIAEPFLLDYPSDSEFGYHPLVIKVTMFSCGGFTVGIGLVHSFVDGYGSGLFFTAVAELASGMSEPTVKPVWQRERLVGIPNGDEPFELFDTGSLAKSPFLPASVLCHECFHVDAESIKRLKTPSIEDAVCDEIAASPLTTVEILCAYVWRSRFRALKQEPDGKTILHLSVGIRHLINPPLPAGYYGNAFVSASVVLSGKELDNWPLSKVARLIKKSKKTVSEADQITKSLNFSEALRQRNMKIDDGGASLSVTDWRYLKLSEEVDFGWKEAVNMIPIPTILGFGGLCVFLPANGITPSAKGGTRVFVSLPAAAMNTFKQEMNALKTKI